MVPEGSARIRRLVCGHRTAAWIPLKMPVLLAAVAAGAQIVPICGVTERNGAYTSTRASFARKEREPIALTTALHSPWATGCGCERIEQLLE